MTPNQTDAQYVLIKFRPDPESDGLATIGACLFADGWAGAVLYDPHDAEGRRFLGRQFWQAQLLDVPKVKDAIRDAIRARLSELRNTSKPLPESARHDLILTAPQHVSVDLHGCASALHDLYLRMVL